MEDKKKQKTEQIQEEKKEGMSKKESERTTKEIAELIKDNIKNFYEIALRLKKIKEGKGYKKIINPETEKPFRTFEEYCNKLWEIASRTARVYIQVRDYIEKWHHGATFINIDYHKIEFLSSIKPELEKDRQRLDKLVFNNQITRDELEKEVKKLRFKEKYSVPVKVKYKIKKGEIWKLDNHRIMCGDSTNEDDINKLMNGKKAEMVLTDPPYNIGHEYRLYTDSKPIKEYEKWCLKWFNILKKNSKLIILTPGWTIKKFWYEQRPFDELVWFDKTKQSGGKSYYLRKSEPILIFGKVINKYNWDTFEVQGDRGDMMRERHACPKPVELYRQIIEKQTKENSIVLDIFGGSGTTLIACESLKRNCYIMEIDPFYCSIIRERYENYKKQKDRELKEE